jgi:hypothetical protein
MILRDRTRKMGLSEKFLPESFEELNVIPHSRRYFLLSVNFYGKT